jgi:NitT/TauT family transport system substrate-binding protein
MKNLFLRLSVITLVVLLVFTFIVSASQIHAQSLPKVKYALDWAWQSSHSAWTIAEDLGYFKEAGLDVTIDRGYGSAATMGKVAAKAYNFGYAPVNALIKFNHENPNDQLIMVLCFYEVSPEAVIYLKKSGIKTPKDLEGRTLSATQGEGTHLMFPIFAKANNLDMNKISWKYVEPQLRDTLVIQGHADATVGWVTTTALNMVGAGVPREDIGYLLYSSYGAQLYSSGLITRKDYAEQNPEVVRAFVKASIRGIRELVANPEKAMESLKRRDPLINVKVELMRQQLLNEIALLTPNTVKNGISDVNKARFDRTAIDVATAFGLNIKPKLEDVYTDKFLPPKSERMLK